jgi:hypothetical protein
VYALREKATEADKTHPVPREQRIQLRELPDGLAVTAAEPGVAGDCGTHYTNGEDFRPVVKLPSACGATVSGGGKVGHGSGGIIPLRAA